MSAQKLNPLVWNVPIVDRDGLPTQDFQRKWQQQQGINSLVPIPSISGSGILVQTGPNTWALRKIVGGTGITVTNGDAVGGNPTIALADTYTVGFGFNNTGLFLAGEELGAGRFSHNVKFPAAVHPSYVTSVYPATANAVLSITVGGVQVGTITFGAGLTTGVIAWSGGSYTLPSGSIIEVSAPSPRDTTLSSITAVLQGDGV